MKSCKNCSVNIGDNYELCFPCFKKERGEPIEETRKPVATKATSAPRPGAWDDDPLIDILMKMNHNLGKIAQALEKKEPAPKQTDLFED